MAQPFSNLFRTIINGVEFLAQTVTSYSAGNPGGAAIGLDPATKRLPADLLPTGIGAATTTATATEILPSNSMVNMYPGGVRLADRSDISKKANGFVKTTVALGAVATIFSDGLSDGRNGLTPGAEYFLGPTPGSVSATPPDPATAPAGTIRQRIGVASQDGTAIDFGYDSPVVVA